MRSALGDDDFILLVPPAGPPPPYYTMTSYVFKNLEFMERYCKVSTHHPRKTLLAGLDPSPAAALAPRQAHYHHAMFATAVCNRINYLNEDPP